MYQKFLKVTNVRRNASSIGKSLIIKTQNEEF